MTTKEYLEQLRFLDMRILAGQRQLEMLHRLGLQVSETESAEETLQRIAEEKAEISRRIDELVNLKAEIRQLISRLQNPDCRTVMELRYLCFLSWDEIAVNMNFSPRYLFRLHDRALKEIGRLKEDTKGHEKTQQDTEEALPALIQCR